MDPETKEDAQSLFYQYRREIKHSVRPFALERHHREFVWSFLRKDRAALAGLLSLIILQSLAEIGALLFINSSISERIYAALHLDILTPLIGSILLGVAVYLLISYFAIRFERKIVLKVINELRQRWFSNILSRSAHSVSNEEKADFIAKMSYHLQLLSTGIDHSVFGFIRWFLFACILAALGFIAGTNVLQIIAGAIVASIVIGVIAYLIAFNYISKEVTSYSQVIRHIALTLSELPAEKNTHHEQTSLEMLRVRVETDTYFRVRRDVWLRYFNRVLFALLFVGSVFAFALAFSHPEIISLFYNPASTILAGIISLYVVRLLYESAQAGLYFPPARLGLFLSVPQNFLAPSTPRTKPWKHLTFKSNKIKLFLEGTYFKDVSISFKPSERVLFVGGAWSGKTSLARMLGGTIEFNPAGWLVMIDGKRLDMDYWTRHFSDRYFFAPQFQSEKTLGELILGKEKEAITEHDLAALFALREKYSLFETVLSKKRFLGESARVFDGNSVALFTIQILYCIVHKTSFIVIDNRWIDSDYEEIEEMLRILAKEVPSSTIVVCARKRNEILSYDATYEIKENIIQGL